MSDVDRYVVVVASLCGTGSGVDSEKEEVEADEVLTVGEVEVVEEEDVVVDEEVVAGKVVLDVEVGGTVLVVGGNEEVLYEQSAWPEKCRSTYAYLEVELPIFPTALPMSPTALVKSPRRPPPPVVVVGSAAATTAGVVAGGGGEGEGGVGVGVGDVSSLLDNLLSQRNPLSHKPRMRLTYPEALQFRSKSNQQGVVPERMGEDIQPRRARLRKAASPSL